MNETLINDQELRAKTKPIVDGAVVFIISIVCIYVVLSIAKSLFPTFPLTINTSWIVNLVASIGITYFVMVGKHSKKAIRKI